MLFLILLSIGLPASGIGISHCDTHEIIIDSMTFLKGAGAGDFLFLNDKDNFL